MSLDIYSESKSVKENDNVVLRCKSKGNPVPKPEIQWFFEDFLIVNGTNSEIADDKVLLRNVQREQSGSYACVATQRLGSLKNVKQKTVDLIVERKISNFMPKRF